MKTGVMVGMSIVVLASVVISVNYFYQEDFETRNQAENKAKDDLRISLVQEELEYGKVPVSTTKLVEIDNGSRKDDNLELLASVKEIDVNKVGETEVTYTLKDVDLYGKSVSITEKYTIKVVDTKPPVISLGKDLYEMSEGDEFDLKSIVTSVKDPVDGDLQYTSGDLQKMTYTIECEGFDVNKPGTYEAVVQAEDENGNISKSSSTIVVNEKEEEEQEEQ